MDSVLSDNERCSVSVTHPEKGSPWPVFTWSSINQASVLLHRQFAHPGVRDAPTLADSLPIPVHDDRIPGFVGSDGYAVRSKFCSARV